MRLEEAFGRSIDSLRAAKRSPHTVDAYRRDLAMVAELLVDALHKQVDVGGDSLHQNPDRIPSDPPRGPQQHQPECYPQNRIDRYEIMMATEPADRAGTCSGKP